MKLQTKRVLGLASIALSLAPAFSRAEAFNPKRVPADVKWVVHADLDLARNTKTFDMIRERVMADGNAQAKFDQIEQLTGMKIPDDMNDVTVYGRDASEEAGTVLVHGKIDRNRTIASLHMANQFSSNAFRTYEVLTWLDTDKNQTMFGAFHDDSNLVIGRTQKNIETALDAMDGKTETLKPDSVLAAGAKPQLLIYVAARNVAELNAAGGKPNPVIQSVDSAWISLSEKDDLVNVKADLTSATPEKATDLRQTIDGLKAMLGLVAGGDKPNPVAKAVVAASKSFKTTVKEKTVSVDWPVPVEQAQAIVQALADTQNGKN